MLLCNYYVYEYYGCDGEVSETIRKVKIVEKIGHKLYRLKPVDGKGELGISGWLQIEGDSANYFYHHCNDLDANIYYIWRPRIYDPPETPAACPRCRYRMDYAPARKRRKII